MLENWLCYCILPMAAGFVLDLIFGDPRRITHPVVFMGKMISALERRLLPEDKAKDAGSAGKVRDPEKNGETGGTGESEAGGKAAESGTTERRRQFLAGCMTALSVAAVSTAVPAALTAVCAAIHPVFGTAAACVLCWQMLAAKSLKRESMKVYDAFRRGETEEARYAVSMIVGRDVSVLDEERKTNPGGLRHMLNQGCASGRIHNHGEHIACYYTQQNGDDFQHSLAPDVEDDNHKDGHQRHQPVVATVVNGALRQGQANGNDNGAGDNGREVTHDLLCAEDLEQQSQHKIQKSGASDTKAGIRQWNLCAGGGDKAIGP